MQGIWIILLAVYTLNSCAAFFMTKTYHEVLMYGQQLSIKLPTEAHRLVFISVDESQKVVLWSRLSITKRGKVTGSSSDKKFVIDSVTYDDQGIYNLFNFWNQKTSIHLLKVVAKRSIQHCVAGESLSIYLHGLPKTDVTLLFSNEDFNLTLVESGSSVGNLHPDYMERIQVTSNSIKVLNVNASDVGNYTLSDRLNRKVEIISMSLVDHHEGLNAAPLMSLLILLGIPPCLFCCCKKKICKKTSQPTITLNTNVNCDDQIISPGPRPDYSGPTPGYATDPGVGGSIVHPPPNPTFPPQQPYSGDPATLPAMPPNPGYTPGYPAVDESISHPPPDPTFPHYQPYSGYPATSPAMPPNPGFAPLIYNASAGPEPVKGDIPPTTPLLPPAQAEGYTPGYHALGESTVHPPSNPTFPPQQPYSGDPATSPAMPPDPVRQRSPTTGPRPDTGPQDIPNRAVAYNMS